MPQATPTLALLFAPTFRAHCMVNSEDSVSGDMSDLLMSDEEVPRISCGYVLIATSTSNVIKPSSNHVISKQSLS